LRTGRELSDDDDEEEENVRMGHIGVQWPERLPPSFVFPRIQLPMIDA
jgi:hypothetical protein